MLGRLIRPLAVALFTPHSGNRLIAPQKTILFLTAYIANSRSEYQVSNSPADSAVSLKHELTSAVVSAPELIGAETLYIDALQSETSRFRLYGVWFV